jgi:hypothetical protein
MMFYYQHTAPGALVDDPRGKDDYTLGKRLSEVHYQKLSKIIKKKIKLICKKYQKLILF